MRLEFTDGNTGTLTYKIGADPQVVKQIERFTFAPLRTACRNN